MPIFSNNKLLKKKMSLIFIRNQATRMELRKSKQPTKKKYTTNTQIDLLMKTKNNKMRRPVSSNAHG
jgi:hypothetical protein